jgi:hypothetical protein
MKTPSFIEVELLSDTTFGRGEGTAGVVDVEVEHDGFGLPFLGGKTLRGLIRDTWLSMRDYFPDLQECADRVFGLDADTSDRSILRIGDAEVDAAAKRWIEVAESRAAPAVSPDAVLASLTSLRRQTSEERRTGAPAETTLRSTRVIIRGLKLRAALNWSSAPGAGEIRCLALALSATRHAGLGRNRGRGHVRLTLDGDGEATRRAARGGHS